MRGDRTLNFAINEDQSMMVDAAQKMSVKFVMPLLASVGSDRGLPA